MRRYISFDTLLVPTLLALVLGMCVQAVSLPAQAQLVQDASIEANDELDAYVGAGGLLLPRSFDGTSQTRTYVADCMECVWKYTLYCAQEATVACAHAVTTCTPGLARYRVKFGTTASEVRTIGSVCWGSGYPATRQQVVDRIRDTALRAVPLLKPGYVPNGKTLTSVPIVAWSGQPLVFSPKPMTIGGVRVGITARPIWRWSWGDSSQQWTANAGSVSMHSGPTHRYLSPGRYRIDVQAVWSARYSISGLGTYSLDDAPLHQYASLDILVSQDRTRLVSHQRPHW